MPNSVMKSFAEKSGKTVAEVEKVWDQAKAEAFSKFGKEDDHFWAYVNATTQKILGLKEEKMKLTFAEFILFEGFFAKRKNTFQDAEEFVETLASELGVACEMWLSSDQKEELFDLFKDNKRIFAKNFNLPSKQKFPERFDAAYTKIDKAINDFEKKGFYVFAEEDNDESKDIIFVQK